MGEACYTCDYCHRDRNEITGGYLYFCKKLRKSVLENWRCGFYKHEIRRKVNESIYISENEWIK